jgi:hypothetical protein
MPWAAVPKTTVDENRDSLRLERNIYCSPLSPRNRGVESVPQSDAEECLPDSKLGWRVASARVLHAPTDAGRGGRRGPGKAGFVRKFRFYPLDSLIFASPIHALCLYRIEATGV